MIRDSLDFFGSRSHIKHLNSPVVVPLPPFPYGFFENSDRTGGHRAAFSAWRRRTRHRRDVTKMLLKQADVGDWYCRHLKQQRNISKQKLHEIRMARMYRSDEHVCVFNVWQLCMTMVCWICNHPGADTGRIVKKHLNYCTTPRGKHRNVALGLKEILFTPGWP